MKILKIYFSGRNSILLLIGLLLGTCVTSIAYPKSDDSVPASLVGVHHLGPNYLIHRFFINKSIGDNVSEGGGGGSMVCCIALPRKWQPGSTVDVRWKVAHIIRSTNPTVQERAEIEGIYHAQVPIEQYEEPGDFYVHFFPNGRVRIVVSPIATDGQQHPVRWGDTYESQMATQGRAVNALFTPEESAERKRNADDSRKEYGGWR